MRPRDRDIIDQWLIGEPQRVDVLVSVSKLASGRLTQYQRHVAEGYLEGFRFWAMPRPPAALDESTTVGATSQSVVERTRHSRSTLAWLLVERRSLLDTCSDHLSELRAIRARQLADRDAALRNLEATTKHRTHAEMAAGG